MAAAVLHDSSHHKQPCTSATCCSPSRLWRAVQTYISTDAKQDLVQLCQDENRGPHVLRVLLTSRLNNDASLYPASHKHRVIQFDASVRPKAVALFGKSATDLNALQLAIFYRRENLAIWLLKYLRPRCSSAEFKMFLHHVWGHKNTSLHLACFFGMHRLVQLLLDMGMAPSIKNARHLTPADCCMNNQECLALLQKSQAPTVVVPKRPLSTSPAVTVSAPKSPVKSTPMTRPVLGTKLLDPSNDLVSPPSGNVPSSSSVTALSSSPKDKKSDANSSSHDIATRSPIAVAAAAAAPAPATVPAAVSVVKNEHPTLPDHPVSSVVPAPSVVAVPNSAAAAAVLAVAVREPSAVAANPVVVNEVASDPAAAAPVLAAASSDSGAAGTVSGATLVATAAAHSTLHGTTNAVAADSIGACNINEPPGTDRLAAVCHDNYRSDDLKGDHQGHPIPDMRQGTLLPAIHGLKKPPDIGVATTRNSGSMDAAYHCLWSGTSDRWHPVPWSFHNVSLTTTILAA